MPYCDLPQAIGAGAHTLDEIANAALVGKTHLAAYLARLQELHFVERRVPVTVPPGKRASSRMGRYHLADPFFRFYYRFVAPQREEVGYRPGKVLPGIQEQLRAFVGATAFEDLCRTWVEQAGEKLPFPPERVGSHWSRSVQADVVAVNWREKHILIGECKWGADKVAREVLTELIERQGPLVLKSLPEEGGGWKPHYALFSRTGATPAAQALAREREVLLVELEQMDHDLAAAQE